MSEDADRETDEESGNRRRPRPDDAEERRDEKSSALEPCCGVRDTSSAKAPQQLGHRQMSEARGVRQGRQGRDGEVAAAEGEREPGEHRAARQHARSAAEDRFVVSGMLLHALDCHDKRTI